MLIKTKLTMSNLGAIILPLLVLGTVLGVLNATLMTSLDEEAHENGVLVLQNQAENALKKAAFNKLTAVGEIKKRQIKDYFTDIEGKLHVVKDNPYVLKLLRELDGAFMEGGDSIDSDKWRALAKKYDPFFDDMIKDLGWYDVFLMCPEGSIVYTANKKPDLGMFVDKEPLKSSPIGKAFHKLQQNSGLEVAFADFQAYAPSNNEPAAMMMARLKNEKGEVEGHVAFQISVKAINHIMHERTGMGKSGETYLVGSDYRMRSDSFLDPQSFSVMSSFMNNNLARSKMIEDALAGKTGEAIGPDYTVAKTGKDNIVLSYYTPLELHGIRWALLAEMDKSEALSASDKMTVLADDIGEKIENTRSNSIILFIAVILALLVVSALIGYFIVSGITKGIITPINGVVQLADKLNKGDLSARVDMGTPIDCSNVKNCSNKECPSFGKDAWCWVEAGSFSSHSSCSNAVNGEDCRDCKIWKMSGQNELEEMGSAINAMVDELNIKAKVATSIAEGDLDQEVNVASGVDALGIALKQMTDNLNSAFGQTQLASEQVNSGASQLSNSASALASGTTQQAASLEEISSSMAEVGKGAKANSENADQAAQLSGQTLEVVNRGNEQMKKMLSSMDSISSASSDIAKIIKVIDEIAFQTNLLALNAAVEAARAGKYGKGFAVVAEEVRSLAARSAEAAKNITELIENSTNEVQSGVDNAGRTAKILDKINESITKVNDLIGEIASASQEQRASIDEMSKGLNQVNDVVQQNSSVSEETASASEELSGQSAQLQKLMSRFKLKQEATATTTNEQPDLFQQETPIEMAAIPPKMITLDDDDYGKR